MFAFRLCLALGELHPDYLLPKLNAEQIHDWEAYFHLRPFGQDHTDLVLAKIGATWIKNGKPMDFLPYWTEQPQTAEEQMSVVGGILAAARGKQNGSSSKS